MQVVSLVWGILAFAGFFVGLIPCLGALNWLNIPFSAAGLIFSIFTFATTRSPDRRASIAGMVLCGIGVLIGAKRLLLGGGIF